MDEPIEGVYFNWLCAKVLPVGVQIYSELLRILYKTEFVWVISGDENRAEDGCELRDDFLRESFLQNDRAWYDSPCSVLEVFIAFAKRANFQTDNPVDYWFWRIIENLGLDEYRQISNRDRKVVEDILYDFVWRQYDESGQGGMFPMRWPKRDQRRVEIWYQFFDYLEEQGL